MKIAAIDDPDALFTVSFMSDWTVEHVAGYQSRSENGVGHTPTGPGLGIELDVDRLGEPLFTVP
jgi:L-alanine-DL-glutamate epimerase-like enolase superfamily enzyme